MVLVVEGSLTDPDLFLEWHFGIIVYGVLMYGWQGGLLETKVRSKNSARCG